MESKAVADDGKRLPWVDWMKVFLIFLVVVGHSGVNPMLRDYIYMFHIPCFFIISGYLHKNTTIKALFRRLFIPTILYTLINLPYNWLYYSYKGWDCSFIDVATGVVKSFVMRGGFPLFAGAWFVIVLLYIKLIVLIGGGGKYYKHFFILSSILILLGFFPEGFEYTLFHRVIYCLPFYCLGILTKERNFIVLIRDKVLLLLLFVFVMIGGKKNGSVDMADAIFGNNILLFALIAVLSFLLLYQLFSCFKSNKVIVIMSNGTLIVLCIHQPIVDVFVQLSQSIDKHYLFVPFFSGACTLIISYYLICKINKNCPILLGK